MGSAFLVMVLAVVAWWGLAKVGVVPDQTITATPSAAAPKKPPAQSGCPLDTALLNAQQTAPLTPEGAAEVAVAYVKWGEAVPQDPTFPAVLAGVATPNFAATEVSLLAAAPARSATQGITRVVPGPTSTDRYRIRSVDPESVTVDLVVALEVTTIAGSGTHGQFFPMILDAVDGHWLLAGFADVPANPYADMPGVPWVTFDVDGC